MRGTGDGDGALLERSAHAVDAVPRPRCGAGSRRSAPMTAAWIYTSGTTVRRKASCLPPERRLNDRTGHLTCWTESDRGVVSYLCFRISPSRWSLSMDRSTTGACTGFAQSREQLGENLCEARPRSSPPCRGCGEYRVADRGRRGRGPALQRGTAAGPAGRASPAVTLSGREMSARARRSRREPGVRQGPAPSGLDRYISARPWRR